MMFDFVGRRVKEYVPTQFYCKHCRRMGSHSTQYHRTVGAPGHTAQAPPGGQHRTSDSGLPTEGGPQGSC